MRISSSGEPWEWAVNKTTGPYTTKATNRTRNKFRDNHVFDTSPHLAH
jgi:hypothetical protein